MIRCVDCASRTRLLGAYLRRCRVVSLRGLLDNLDDLHVVLIHLRLEARIVITPVVLCTQSDCLAVASLGSRRTGQIFLLDGRRREDAVRDRAIPEDRDAELCASRNDCAMREHYALDAAEHNLPFFVSSS
jgi:hypothetical protein